MTLLYCKNLKLFNCFSDNFQTDSLPLEDLSIKIKTWENIEHIFSANYGENSQQLQDFYQSLAKAAHIPELRTEIQQWLDDLDERRRKTKDADFYRNL